MRHTRKTLKFTVVLFVAFIFFFGARHADAATLYFSPSSGNFSVGNILTASVLVNTQGQAINNADATINFPAGLLDIVSVNKSGSIFSLWVEEPSFSNSAGTITFNGGLPTPGYNGSSGKIINIVFRARSAGAASLVFSSGAVRANDGYGTDILQTRSQALFNLISEERPVVPPAALGAPQAPRISSKTHPDSDKWYSNSTATFSWVVGDDVNASRLLIGKLPVADPIVLYVPPIGAKTIDDLDDGVWYFHAQLRNDSGWGPSSHFRLQVDTKKPDNFDIRLAPDEDLTSPNVKLIFDATDGTSGIDHYEIQIDGKDAVEWKDDGTGVYETPSLSSGKHILIGKAFDAAGNFLTSSIEFTVEAIDPPIITEYPREINSGEVLVVKGTTYPDSDVIIWIQENDKAPDMYSVRSDEKGEFTFISEEGLGSKVYKLWAEVTDIRGAKSPPSEIVTIIVRQPTFLRIGTFAVGFLSVLIPLLALIGLLIFLIWYGWHKFTMFKKRLRKEVSDVEKNLHQAFDLLREDIREQIKTLEEAKTRRQLTKEEEKVIRRLRRDLNDAEDVIKKEIRDIEREIK